MRILNGMADPVYEADFVAWTEQTARSLRERRFDDIDRELLAQEIEDLGRRDRKEVNSRIKTILSRLLKVEYQFEKKSESWVPTISREGGELPLRFDDSPTLAAKGRQKLPVSYRAARRGAALETGLPLTAFA